MGEYVYACGASTADGMADMMHEHLGKDMIALIWVNSARKHRITLAAIGGENVAFWFEGKRYVKHINDVFGQGPTLVLS